MTGRRIFGLGFSMFGFLEGFFSIVRYRFFLFLGEFCRVFLGLCFSVRFLLAIFFRFYSLFSVFGRYRRFSVRFYFVRTGGFVDFFCFYR